MLNLNVQAPRTKQGTRCEKLALGIYMHSNGNVADYILNCMSKVLKPVNYLGEARLKGYTGKLCSNNIKHNFYNEVSFTT